MSSPSLPPYTLLSASGYVFRLHVPAPLRPLFGRQELRYSLRTASRSTARTRALFIAGRLRGLMDRIKKDEEMRRLTKADVQTIAREYIAEGIAIVEDSGLIAIKDNGRVKFSDFVSDRVSKMFAWIEIQKE